jgi:hypothetical protein
MKLKEYISWTNSIDEYKDSASLAKLDTWGYEVLPGSVRLPKLNLENTVKGDEGYDSVRNDLITNWAKVTWPFLTCIDAKIQIQRPGEECKPHLDFLGDYLENVCQTLPGLLNVEHTLEKPAINVWRMFIATEDHVPGQVFSVNNNEWVWKAGDCMRLNNWQALHWTKNTSQVDRAIIKITGIKS